MAPKLGILAGRGTLPKQLAEAAIQAGREVFVVAFEGHAEADVIGSYDHVWVRLGAASKIVKVLKRAGCDELVMAGGVRRPTFAELRPDLRAARVFIKSGLAAMGDDGLLRVVRKELEGEGFRLVAPQDVTGNLLMPEGLIVSAPAELMTGGSEGALSDELRADLEKGVQVLLSLAPHDVGQAIVIQQGLVLGIEAIEGTAELVSRVKGLHRKGRGGVLVKISKPLQDDTFDLPTIGPDTVKQAHASGLCGIAVEAGRALFLEPEQVKNLCKECGLFLMGLRVDSASATIIWS